MHDGIGHMVHPSGQTPPGHTPPKKHSNTTETHI